MSNVSPERLDELIAQVRYRCCGCGDLFREDEVGPLRGHTRVALDSAGYEYPTLCGPVSDQSEPMGMIEALRELKRRREAAPASVQEFVRSDAETRERVGEDIARAAFDRQAAGQEHSKACASVRFGQNECDCGAGQQGSKP